MEFRSDMGLQWWHPPLHLSDPWHCIVSNMFSNAANGQSANAQQHLQQRIELDYVDDIVQPDKLQNCTET